MKFYATKGNVQYTIEQDLISTYEKRGFAIKPVEVQKVTVEEVSIVEQPISDVVTEVKKPRKPRTPKVTQAE